MPATQEKTRADRAKIVKWTLDVALLGIGIFFVWGAFWVNLPLKNYVWVVYDIAMLVCLVVLRMALHFLLFPGEGE